MIIAEGSKEDDVLQPSVEDPVDPVATFATSPPYTNPSDDEPEEYVIEISDPGGCAIGVGSDRGAVGILLLMIFAAFGGWRAVKNNKTNKD